MLRRVGKLVGLAAPAALLALLCLEVAAETGGAIPESAVQRTYGSYAPIIWSSFEVLVGVVLTLLVALPFQALFPAVRRHPKILTYEFWLDVLYSYQGLWLSLASFYVAVNWLVAAVYGNSGPYIPALAQLPYWVQVPLAVWAFDFLVYWRHRLEHTLSPMWAFHAVHHSTERVDILTTFRVHPFELITGTLVNTMVIRAGLEPTAALLGFSIYLYYNQFIHTNVAIRFPGLLKYVLVSPFMHYWHHAKENVIGKNYGVVFAWNDWLFSTACHPEHYPADYGLNVPAPQRVEQSYLRQLLYPLQYGYARFLEWRGARAARLAG